MVWCRGGKGLGCDGVERRERGRGGAPDSSICFLVEIHRGLVAQLAIDLTAAVV